MLLKGRREQKLPQLPRRTITGTKEDKAADDEEWGIDRHQSRTIFCNTVFLPCESQVESPLYCILLSCKTCFCKVMYIHYRCYLCPNQRVGTNTTYAYMKPYIDMAQWTEGKRKRLYRYLATYCRFLSVLFLTCHYINWAAHVLHRKSLPPLPCILRYPWLRVHRSTPRQVTLCLSGYLCIATTALRDWYLTWLESRQSRAQIGALPSTLVAEPSFVYYVKPRSRS